MKNVLVIALSVSVLNSVSGGKLLALHFADVTSYVRIMDEVIRFLAPHHSITLYSIVHEKPPHPNVTLVKVKAPPKNDFFNNGLFEALCIKGKNYIGYEIVTSPDQNFIENILANENVTNLIHGKEKYDALITFSLLSEFVYQLSHVLHIPLIQISSMIPVLYINDAVGNPLYLSTIQNVYDSSSGYTFMERVHNYVTNLMVYIRYNWQYIPQIEQVTYKYYPRNTPSIAQVHRNTSLLIANINDAMGHARPHMPNVINIGGIHCRPAKPLPDDLEDFIKRSGEHGVIYFSLGSSIKSKFPIHIQQTIIRVLAKLPQRILWKFNEDIANIPSNVKISKWFPQQDILGHNKTRLFITQAGMFSMQEASYHGVPVLAIPITVDQPFNAITAHSLGYGEYISFCDFSEDTFYQLILKLIEDSKYKENAINISHLMTDSPMTASEKLIWWVNYIIRHRGNPLVASLKDKSYGLQKLDVDVFSFLCISIIFILILLLYTILHVKLFVFQRCVVFKKKTE